MAIKSFELSGGIVVEDIEQNFSNSLKRALKDDRYELMERRAIAAAVRPSDRIVELGAGCGVIGTCLARASAPSQVTSVEANPDLLPIIAHTHACNGVTGITVINALVGAADGKATFYISSDFWASSLSPDTPDIARSVEIDTLDVNELLRNTGANVLVCDIEGAEYTLFPDIDWRQIDLVVAELHPDTTDLARQSRLFHVLMTAGLYPDLAAMERPRVMVFKRNSRV